MNTRFIETRTSAISFALLGALCTTAALVATARYGPGYSADGVTYLATARNLVAGAGFFGHENLYVAWPPLFPLLMAGAEAAGGSAMQAARWINALSYGGAVCAAAWLNRRAIASRALVWWSTLAMAFTPALFVQAVKARTDMLFALLVLLFTCAAMRHLHRPSRSRLFWLALCAALASLQRYVGVWLVGCGTILVVARPLFTTVAGAALRPEQRWRQALGFLAGASLPLTVWLARNLVVSGTLTGPRGVAVDAKGSVLSEMLRAAALWLAPPVVPSAWVWASVLAVGALVAGLAWHLGEPAREDGDETNTGRRAAHRRTVHRTAGLIVGSYVFFLVVASVLSWSSLPGRRLLMPAFPLLVLLVGSGLDNASRCLAAAGRSRIRLLVLALAFAWLTYPLLTSTAYLKVRYEIGGGGLNTEPWQQSQTAAWLRAHRAALSGDPVRSNGRHALYFLTGIPQHRPASGRLPGAPQDERAPSQRYYLVCFDDPQRARLHPRRLVGELASLVPGVSSEQFRVPALPNRHPPPDCFAPQLVPPSAKLTTLAALDDGTVYRVTPK